MQILVSRSDVLRSLLRNVAQTNLDCEKWALLDHALELAGLPEEHLQDLVAGYLTLFKGAEELIPIICHGT
jgi:phosphoserine phosphatase